jgi:hypothetical protein
MIEEWLFRDNQTFMGKTTEISRGSKINNFDPFF